MSIGDPFDEIVGKPKAPLKPKEVEALWQRLLETNLSGRKVSFGSHGGDMDRIDAIIDKVHEISGKGIVLEIREATVTREGEGVLENPVPIDLKRFVLSKDDHPKFSGRKTIILGGGAEYFENSSGEQFEYGETLHFGIIY